MDNSFHQLGIRDLQRYFPVSGAESLSDDFFISDVHYIDAMQLLREPCRFDGYLGVFCMRGRLKVEINLKTYEIGEKSLVIIIPGTIGRVYSAPDPSLEDLHFVVVAMSRSFLSEIRMDFLRLYEESLVVLDNPVLVLTDEELGICGRYFNLVRSLVRSGSPGLQDAICQIVSSAFRYFGAIWQQRLNAPSPLRGQEGRHLPVPEETGAAGPETVPPVRSGGVSARSKMLFNSFLKLVAEHHSRERGMTFYAEKLCLTPKYLSKVVKEVSGKSGPDWIDSYVILEAKNMLKYSDMPIKEIVYRLHFPNASVFYKFFKSHTGQTPTDYRGK